MFKKVFVRSLSVIVLPILAWLGFMYSFRFLDHYAASSSKFENNTDIYNSSSSFFDKSWSNSLINLITITLGNYDNDQMGLDDFSININYIIYLLLLFLLPFLIINIFLGITIDELRRMIEDSRNHNIRLRCEYALKIQDVLVNNNNKFKRFKFWHKFVSWAVLLNIFETRGNKLVFFSHGKSKLVKFIVSEKESKNDVQGESDSKESELIESLESFMIQIYQRMDNRLNQIKYELERKSKTKHDESCQTDGQFVRTT